MIKTFDEAYRFILDAKICTVFGSKGFDHPSLWEQTDLSEEKPAEGGWSPKVMAVWDWKTRIPETYPEEIFYGKIQNGDAALMEMSHFRDVHFHAAYVNFQRLDPLPQAVFGLIRSSPDYTGKLRKLAMAEFSCNKSQFDTALKKLQTSLNIIRCNDARFKNDYWLPMSELHPELVLQQDRG